MTRIAITGIGTINALGTGIAAFVDGLRAGRCGIGTVSAFPTAGFRTTCAAAVPAIVPPAWLADKVAQHASRSALLALIAAHEAWSMAGLGAADAAPMGIVLGTTTGGMATGEEAFRLWLQNADDPHRLAAWLETPVAVPIDHLARVFGFYGPRLTVSTACSSGANALGVAADWIRAGHVEAVVCGGTDSLCRMTYSGFNVLQALDRVPCRPFDKHRAGLTLGEGAAVFIFEDWERAQARGAPIIAEFVSSGVSADAHHLTQPKPDGSGAVLAMQRALAEGAVAPEEIDYINAHGTGTPLNDAIETRAIKSVFGTRAYAVPVTSTKSMIGHCLGAAGALEALTCVLAMRERFVPPTATLQVADPECDLDYVPRSSRTATLHTVLSNSYGFGGNNTSIVLRGVA